MWKLIIKHKKKLLQEVDLQENQEYHIGRGADNDIVLPNQHGVSRKHLILQMSEEGHWLVRNLSQASPLTTEGEEREEVVLEPGSSFQIMDFEFFIEGSAPESAPLPAESAPASAAPASAESESAPPPAPAELPAKAEEEKALAKKEELELKESPQEPSAPVSSEGKTAVMDMSSESSKQMTAVLKIPNEGQVDVFKLEDQSEWLAGRDPDGDVFIENDSCSRKHFKIKKEGSQYFISDLKSKNGTMINDSELKPGKPYLLRSGDKIYILDIEIDFEIRNLFLEKELISMKAPVFTPPAPVSPQQQNEILYAPSPPQPVSAPGVVIEGEAVPESFYQKNRKRILIYGAVLLVVGGGWFYHHNQEAAKKQKSEQAQTKQNLNPGGLSDKQLEIVKDIYQQARLLYAQGQFQYCKSEIKKIYKYIDSYEQSKKLEVACAQASENRQRQFEIEEQKRKEEEANNFIIKVSSECGEKFNSFVLKSELMSCLQPALELAPLDGRITSLIDRFETNEALKKAEEEAKRKRRKFIQSILVKYDYAKSLYKKGKIEKAMSAYQKFIKVSGHKELFSKRDQAKRELANIQKEYNDNISRLVKNCESKYKAGQWKIAYDICKNSSKKLPEGKKKPALHIMQKIKDRLAIQMKPLYEEAAINESMGNVGVAKDYWNKILLKDVKDGVYYIKARAKLNNY